MLQKLSTMSATVSSTVAVPNSLGPAELLLHYGSEEQKNHYLPRLAVGEEIPCFALTGPYAGSDATSIPDYGIVCKQMVDGVETLGIKLTFDKRYITLAPVATVIGLAFRMYDPEHLLGDKEDLGITLALLPRSTPGLEIGRRHFPLNVPFQNGPVHGKDVFVPLSTLIGGPKMAGHGWRMLVECLSVGRAISLPSNATGACAWRVAGDRRLCAHAQAVRSGDRPLRRRRGGAGAHRRPDLRHRGTVARHGGGGRSRREAGGAVGDRQVPRHRMGRARSPATRWTCTAARACSSGPKQLRRSRLAGRADRDHGGRRQHHDAQPDDLRSGRDPLPSVRAEGNAGAVDHRPRRAAEDLRSRCCSGISASASPMPCAASRWASPARASARAAGDAYTRRYYRKLNRYSAALALCADVFMGVLGGKLKFKEKLSARLGDVLSYLYIASAMLKRYEDTGRPEADRPLLAWAFHECVWHMQMALDGAIRNFPVRPVGWLLRVLVFPFGRREVPPSDRLGRRVAALITAPSEARDRLTEWTYLTPTRTTRSAA